MIEALAGMPEGLGLEETAEPPKILIEDKIAAIVHSLQRGEQISFQAILSSSDNRLDIVVSFLAILELIKDRRVMARQEVPFADIELSRGPNWEAVQIEGSN